MASQTAPETSASGESLKSLFGQRLEPYLALSKSAKGAGCVQLIKDALAAPGVMVFGELLDMPNVVEVSVHANATLFLSLAVCKPSAVSVCGDLTMQLCFFSRIS